MCVRLTTPQWSVSYQTQVKNKYFRNTLMGRKNRSYKGLLCILLDKYRSSPFKESNNFFLISRGMSRIFGCEEVWFAAVFLVSVTGRLGWEWGYLENTACCILKSFRGPVIKVSVSDVLLKWIFHGFQRSLRHFLHSCGLIISLHVCVSLFFMWNEPRGQLCPQRKEETCL